MQAVCKCYSIMQAVWGLKTKYNIGLCNLKGFRSFVYSILNFDVVVFVLNHL
jgi:hypothetical protein